MLILAAIPAQGQMQCDDIELNQVGYYPNSSKLAFVTYSSRDQDFYIVSADGTDTVYHGWLGERRRSAYSSTTARIADFSLFTATGSYVLRIGNKQSFPFEIKNDVYTDLGKAVLKSFYFQRSSIPLESQYAGKWSRSSKHSGDVIIVRPSTFSDDRGSIIPSPGGWYNKSDFNKCIVTSGITMSTMLSAYEDFTNYFDTLTTDIPESNDKIPDVLNEILYNLRWMFTMQDPNDGGVYHKCINAKVEEVKVVPDIRNLETVQKTTAAALDFAAVMAQAGRIFRRMKTQLPGLADSCLRASSDAWFWALKNPDVIYKPGAQDSKLRTANYADDGEINDEWMWAATEMFVSSKNRMYFDVMEQGINDSVSLPSVNNVRMLAYYTMLRHADNLPAYAIDITRLMRDRVLRIANDYLAHISSNAFATVMGQSKSDFVYGSNAVAANQGILLINAYLVTGNEKYVAASMTNLDYLLGRNATGYCFVTGCFGIKSPLHPYFIVPEKSEEPVPGLLVGGPYTTRQDRTLFSPSPEIETAYRDSDTDSQTNQVSIDWNSSMVYLVNAVQAMQYELGFSRRGTPTIAVNR